MKATRLLSLLSLLAWGGLMLYIYYSDRITAYLHPTFRPLVVVAGWTLVLLAIIYWLFSHRGSYADHEHEELVVAGPPPEDDTVPASQLPGEHAHGHTHEHAHAHEHAHDHDHDHHDCCGHDHQPALPGLPHSHDHDEQPLTAPRLAGFFILLVPALSAAMVSEDSFSMAVFENRLPMDTLPIPPSVLPQGGMIQDDAGFFEHENILDYFDRSPDGHVKVEVIDLLYGSMDAIFRRDFAGQEVELIGQALPQRSRQRIETEIASRPDDLLERPVHVEPDLGAETADSASLDGIGQVDAGDEEFLLGRMFILCCAADARPVTIRIEYVADEPLPEAGWVRIVGVPDFRQEEGVWVTVLKAHSVTTTTAPREIFLF